MCLRNAQTPTQGRAGRGVRPGTGPPGRCPPPSPLGSTELGLVQRRGLALALSFWEVIAVVPAGSVSVQGAGGPHRGCSPERPPT